MFGLLHERVLSNNSAHVRSSAKPNQTDAQCEVERLTSKPRCCRRVPQPGPALVPFPVLYSPSVLWQKANSSAATIVANFWRSEIKEMVGGVASVWGLRVYKVAQSDTQARVTFARAACQAARACPVPAAKSSDEPCTMSYPLHEFAASSPLSPAACFRVWAKWQVSYASGSKRKHADYSCEHRRGLYT